MKLHCLGTGSSGNCYILESNNGNQLILDLGVSQKDIVTNTAFKSWKNVKGALITHSHKDHSLSLYEITMNGINTYTYGNTQILKAFLVASTWKIMPFKCYHDKDIDCFGFIIKDLAENKTLVYATDTAKLPPIKDIDYWLVECNYDGISINESIQADEASYSYLGRVMETHMKLEYLYDYFISDFIKKPSAIIACHLSQTNCDRNRVKKLLGDRADFFDIAAKGKEWDLC